MAIHIIHHTRTTGKENTFHVGRPTVLANPYTQYPPSVPGDVKVASHGESIKEYEDYFYDIVDAGEDKEFLEALEDILIAAEENEHVYLSCRCKDELNPFQTDYALCHADVIRNYINDELAEMA